MFGIDGIISGGMGLIGQGMANDANENLANDQRDWNERMWGKQNKYNEGIWGRDNKYNESQRDNERSYREKYEADMWNKTNKYNSPQEQMARLKEAGLNPHLMYGKGTVGSAGSAGQGASTNTKAANQPTPSVQGYSRAQSKNILQGINVFKDNAQLKNLQAQTDNVQQSTDNLKEDQALKKQNLNLGLIGLDSSKLTNKKAHALYDYSLEVAQLDTQKRREDLRQNVSRGNVQIQTQDSQIKQGAADLANKIAATKGQNLSNTLKQFEVDLNKYGLNNNSGTLYKVALRAGEQLKKMDLPKSKTIINFLKDRWSNH